jgi:translocator protein
MERLPALLTASTAAITAQAVGSLRGPTPGQPKTAAWYAKLRKPSFTPPGPVFGIAWSFLDGLLGYAGYRLLLTKPSNARSTALVFWGLNLLGVSGFSWVLFGRKRLDEATAVSLTMVVTSAAAAAAASRVDKHAARAITPLIGWVIFASVLQEEVWRRND